MAPRLDDQPTPKDKLAGRLLLDLDIDNGLVGLVDDRFVGDFHGLEETKVADPLTRAAQLGGVEGIPLDQQISRRITSSRVRIAFILMRCTKTRGPS